MAFDELEATAIANGTTVEDRGASFDFETQDPSGSDVRRKAYDRGERDEKQDAEWRANHLLAAGWRPDSRRADLFLACLHSFGSDPGHPILRHHVPWLNACRRQR